MTLFPFSRKMLMLGDGHLSEDDPNDEDDDLVIGLSKVLFVFFMVGINVFMLNLMINLMDDFMYVSRQCWIEEGVNNG